MKTSKPFILLFLIRSVLDVTVSANNGSYCCWDNEEIWVDMIDGSNHCLNLETNKTTKITLSCFANLTEIIPTEFWPVKLHDDGSLGLIGEMLEEITSIKKGDFCLGNQPQDLSNTSAPVVIICVDDDDTEYKAILLSEEVLGYSLAVSSVFFALTAVVYQALPEIRDLQGKSIISLCSTEVIANILFFVLLMEYSYTTWCAVRGFLAYYFMVSAFFWMNAIAIQILITTKHSLSSNDAWKKYKWYAVYAWGTPALLTLILIIINYHPGSHKRPGIGLNYGCWFFDLQRTWIYLYSVLATLLIANVGIFVYVSIILCRNAFSSSHLRTLRYKCCIMFRLFIIMGLPLVLELVNSLLPMNNIWAIIDIINSLQGVIVFLILVVFRRRVLRALEKRKMLFFFSGVVATYLQGADDEDDILTPTLGVPMGEGVF